MNNRLLTCALLLAAMPAALAQNIAPPSDGAGSPAPFAGQRPQGPGGPESHEGHMGGGGGIRILPPGTWWKDPQTVTALSLSPDQQKRIEDLFIKSRVDLIHAHATLQEDELLLEPILNASTFDQAKAQAQIDKIADTRAALEKTDAHMLLSIRGVLTPDQWTKLQAQRGRGKHEMEHGQGGPMGPGGYDRGAVAGHVCRHHRRHHRRRLTSIYSSNTSKSDQQPPAGNRNLRLPALLRRPLN